MMMFPKVKNLFMGSVRRQLITSVALVYAVLMSVSIYDLVLRQEKTLIQHQAKHAMALARTLAVSSAGWLAANDIAGLGEILQAQQNYPELMFALLTDTDGVVLAHTDRQKLGLKVIDLPETAHFEIIGKTKTLIDVAAPVMLAGRHVGWARVGIGAQKTHHEMQKSAQDGVFYALFAIFIGSLMAWFMGRKVTGRLYAIQKTINAVKTGDHDARTRLSGSDEAAILAIEFNAMLDTLSQRDAQLKETTDELIYANLNLEKIVLERTLQVNASLEQVRKREFELKIAQSVAHIGSWTLNVVNDKLTWSDETYTIFGIEAGTPLSMEQFLDCIHPIDRERVIGAWSDAMTGSPYDIEHRILVAGQIKWVHEKAQMEFDENGEAISGIGTVQDITERRQAEETTRRLAAIIESSNDAIISETLEGTITIWNKAAEKLFGYSAREAIGMDISHLWPEEIKSDELAILPLIKEGLDVSQYESQRLRSDGTAIDVSITLFPIYDVDGKIVAASEIISDITDRKKTERKIAEAEERLRTIFESSPDAYLITNPDDGRIIDCNPVTEAMLGGTRDQIIGKTADEISPLYQPNEKTSAEAVAEKHVKALEHGSNRFEWMHQRFDGSHFWVDVSIVTMTLSKRQVHFISWRDISERKRMEQELERTLKSLAESNQELEHFAYIASHDLQEPLRMVSSYVQLLSQRYKDQLDADANDFINYAVDGATRMKGMIDALLSYARVNTRGRELMPVDSNQVLADSLKNLELAIEDNEAIVSYDPLPRIKADEIQFGQLFQNLISNAIKFKKPDVPPRVHICARRESNEWHFSIADNGIGIDLKDSERIFLIFQRLHTRQQYPGTGIGLALCKKIVERHGGRIWVESEKDLGCTVHFTIPAITEESVTK